MPCRWWGAVSGGVGLYLLPPPVLWDGRPGFRDPCVLRAVGVALSPWLACPVGAACSGGGGGRPRGGWPATVERGVWCQALSLSGAGSRGSTTRVSRVRLVWAWGPSTGPTAYALVGERCALWGWRKGVPGGDAFRRCEGRLRSDAYPPPTARPSGGQPGFRDPCVPGAVGAGVGTLHCPHSVRPPGLALRAVGVAEGRPRGGRRSPL